jgi:hypothetical protein
MKDPDNLSGTVGLTRIIMGKNLWTLLINEFGTSSRYHKTFAPCKSVFVGAARRPYTKSHQGLCTVVLIPEGEPYDGHVQKDRQARVIMWMILAYRIRYGTRHPAFARA